MMFIARLCARSISLWRPKVSEVDHPGHAYSRVGRTTVSRIGWSTLSQTHLTTNSSICLHSTASQGDWSKVCFDMFYAARQPYMWNMPLSKWTVVACGNWAGKQQLGTESGPGVSLVCSLRNCFSTFSMIILMPHMVFRAVGSHCQHSGQVGYHSLIWRNCLFIGEL